jgi:tetratricopeptide (TPR) repeat protein
MPSPRFARLIRPCLLSLLCIHLSSPIWSQQLPDTADRLWQDTEKQILNLRRQAKPESQDSQRMDSDYEAALQALTQTPKTRIQKITFAILDAVNHRNWFRADRLLRQYGEIPHHDPALFDFVAAARLAAAGDYGSAIKLYRKVLVKNEGFVRGELDLARALYADNRLGDARVLFERLRTLTLPAAIAADVENHLQALRQRIRPQFSMNLAWVYGDNVSKTSTSLDTCAITFNGSCMRNTPGQKNSDSGVSMEAGLNKIWPLHDNHSLLLRSLAYGNHYQHDDSYDTLVSTSYLGYQYSSAYHQIQILPSFEYDREGRYTIYRAPGLRLSWRHQLSHRSQLEASLEYKRRDFSSRYSYLEGDLRGAGLFGIYEVWRGWMVFSNLLYRESDAETLIYAYREWISRIGFYKAFGNAFTLNVTYGHRYKKAAETYSLFVRRQRDHENSLYLTASIPRWSVHGFTPTLSYEYRKNNSSIPHAYNYEQSRITLGFNKKF